MKKNHFWIFSENMEECRKMWKMMKMCQILMKTVKINEKWKKIISGFFQKNMDNLSEKVKNDKNGSDIDEKSQNWWKMKKKYFLDFFKTKYV